MTNLSEIEKDVQMWPFPWLKFSKLGTTRIRSSLASRICKIIFCVQVLWGQRAINIKWTFCVKSFLECNVFHLLHFSPSNIWRQCMFYNWTTSSTWMELAEICWGDLVMQNFAITTRNRKFSISLRKKNQHRMNKFGSYARGECVLVVVWENIILILWVAE